jgi:hypothetical protein
VRPGPTVIATTRGGYPVSRARAREEEVVGVRDEGASTALRIGASWDLSLVRSQVRPSRPAWPSRFGLATWVRRVRGAGSARVMHTPVHTRWVATSGTSLTLADNVK